MADSDEDFEASRLDDITHAEMRIIHQTASQAILFAKLIQWLAIGFTIALFTAAVFLGRLSPSDPHLANVLSFAIILLTCASIFLVLMYQMWQFNEIRRIRKIEKTFSTLCKKIHMTESKGERKVERYTVLIFMMLLVVGAAVIALMIIQ